MNQRNNHLYFPAYLVRTITKKYSTPSKRTLKLSSIKMFFLMKPISPSSTTPSWPPPIPSNFSTPTKKSSKSPKQYRPSITSTPSYNFPNWIRFFPKMISIISANSCPKKYSIYKKLSPKQQLQLIEQLLSGESFDHGNPLDLFLQRIKQGFFTNSRV